MTTLKLIDCISYMTTHYCIFEYIILYTLPSPLPLPNKYNISTNTLVFMYSYVLMLMVHGVYMNNYRCVYCPKLTLFSIT